MKNLIVCFLVICSFVACSTNDNQSADNQTDNSSASTAAEPNPVARPAAVNTSPDEDMKEKGMTVSDEVPATPGMDKADKKEMVAPKDKIAVEPEEKITTVIKNKKKAIEEDTEETVSAVDARIEEEKRKLEQEVREKGATSEQAVEQARNKIREKTDKVKDKMNEKKESVKEKMDFSHKIFDDLLRDHVSNTGKVDYAGFKKDHNQLKMYIKSLEEQQIDDWNKDKKMAYWINAYNANTINLILDNYPVSSINDIAGGKPFDKKIANLDGKSLSLNDIENNIIRPQFKDARIHFAVNCAAKSCPPLWYRAWTEKNLNKQLDEQTKSFVNNPTYNTINSNEVIISKIFDWYKDDFGTIQDFLGKYSDKNVKKGATVNYKDYDWALNK